MLELILSSLLHSFTRHDKEFPKILQKLASNKSFFPSIASSVLLCSKKGLIVFKIFLVSNWSRAKSWKQTFADLRHLWKVVSSYSPQVRLNIHMVYVVKLEKMRKLNE